MTTQTFAEIALIGGGLSFILAGLYFLLEPLVTASNFLKRGSGPGVILPTPGQGAKALSHTKKSHAKRFLILCILQAVFCFSCFASDIQLTFRNLTGTNSMMKGGGYSFEFPPGETKSLVPSGDYEIIRQYGLTNHLITVPDTLHGAAEVQVWLDGFSGSGVAALVQTAWTPLEWYFGAVAMALGWFGFALILRTARTIGSTDKDL